MISSPDHMQDLTALTVYRGSELLFYFNNLIIHLTVITLIVKNFVHRSKNNPAAS